MVVLLWRVARVARLRSGSIGGLGRLRHRWWRYRCCGRELGVLRSGGLDNAAEHACVDKT